MTSSTSQSVFSEARRDDHVVVRPDDAGGRLVEEDRFGRDRRPGLLGMIDEVEADGNEIAGPRDAGAEARAGGRGWKRRRIDPLQPLKALAREGGTVHVGDHAREVADPPVAVDEAGLLLSFGAEADEFHACSSWARPLGAAVFWTALRPQTSLVVHLSLRESGPPVAVLPRCRGIVTTPVARTHRERFRILSVVSKRV